jgi:hypothetical protein
LAPLARPSRDCLTKGGEMRDTEYHVSPNLKSDKNTKYWNALYKRMGAINRIQNPPMGGISVFLAELFTEDRMIREPLGD